ncbi:MAG: hypothetical protein BGO63_06905 [Candidatus Accumulibacter sp. 66-26]|nr:MAG: hypothetical protein BGO63_06905 [Candidatus Accumulibacter sp. 66-26]
MCTDSYVAATKVKHPAVFASAFLKSLPQDRSLGQNRKVRRLFGCFCQLERIGGWRMFAPISQPQLLPNAISSQSNHRNDAVVDCSYGIVQVLICGNHRRYGSDPVFPIHTFFSLIVIKPEDIRLDGQACTESRQ